MRYFIILLISLCYQNNAISSHPTEVNSCRLTDSLNLISFYENSRNPNWSINWYFNQPISSWHEISLDPSGCVKALELVNILKGHIGSQVGNLSELESLNKIGEGIEALNLIHLKG